MGHDGRSRGAARVIAFVFPGQGSQKVGMGRTLAAAFPEARAVFDEADAAFAAVAGADADGTPARRFSDIIFDGPDDQLTLTEHAQPAILTVSTAACRVLKAHGIEPAFVAGHSLGEYSAHVAAGTFSFRDAVAIVRRRGRYMQEAVPVGEGAMVAILGADPAIVRQAGEEAALGEVVAEERLAPELRALARQTPRVPIVANVDAELKRDAAEGIEALVRQVSAPVRWDAVVRRLASEGVTTYVEVGPGTVLSGLVQKLHTDARVIHFGSPEDLGAVMAAC